MLSYRSALVLMAMLLTRVHCVDIGEVHWGFAGKVVPGHVNPLSVVVSNPAAVPFAGVLTLSAGGNLSHHGAAWVASCYLAPHTSRRVQFYPWIDEAAETFELRWKPGDGHAELDPPDAAAPAAVVFVDDAVLTAGGALRRCPDELMPPTVAACDGLACAVLDHAPRWQAEQRQAFRDWLWRGGTVVLVSGLDGHQPHFGQGLEFLDQPGDRLVLGAGQLLRLDGTVAQLTAERLKAAGVAIPALHTDERYFQPLGGRLFRELAELVKPHHAWGAIYTVLFFYLLIIGFGACVAAVKGMDYRLVNLGVIAVIVACALLLWVVGRRGSGERAVVSAIAYAQALGDGDFAATQWSSCFVTASGDYAITHPGGLSLFSCPSDAEEADAVISVERGELKASIPLFSSRTFVHSARIHLAGTEPQVVASKADAQLRELSIRLPAGGAARSWSERMLNARAVYRDRIYSLARANEVLTLTPGSASTLEEFTGIVAQRANMYPGVASGDDAGKRLRLLDEDFETLIAYGLGGHGLSRDWCDQRRDPDQVALFLLVDQAPAFHIADGMASQGRAVLRFDLPLTRSAP